MLFNKLYQENVDRVLLKWLNTYLMQLEFSATANLILNLFSEKLIQATIEKNIKIKRVG